MMSNDLLIDADLVRGFVLDLFTHCGWPRRESSIVADHLVLSDQSGHPSHGTGMLGTYMTSFLAGRISPQHQPLNLIDAAPFHVVDARFALGHVAALDLVDRAIATVDSHGIAVCNLLRAHHVGRVGHYAERAAASGLVSVFWGNVFGRPPLVAPFGATQARLGTNPHCIGVPVADGVPIVLDFATSRIALGKTRVAHVARAPVPQDCLLDHAGKPTRDASVMFVEPLGSLLPFGEHKGSGLAVVAEIMASIFSGAETIADLNDAGMIANNLFAIFFDPRRLGRDPAGYATQLRGYTDWVTGARRADDGNPIMMPGEPERLRRRELGNHVRLSRQDILNLNKAANAVGAPVLAL